MNIKQIKISKIPLYLKMISRQDKPIKFMIGTLMALSGLSKYYIIDLGNFKLRFFPTTLSLGYFKSGNNRKGDEIVLLNYLSKNDNYVDVGANIGALALAAANIVGPGGKIVAIEAHPRTAYFLEENVKLNSFTNITTLNLAVGNEDGFLHFSDNGSDDENHVTTDGKGLSVPIKTLDSLISLEKIKLLKIDVEGYELFVLKGAQNVLQKSEIVFIEIFEKNFNRYSYSTNQLISYLIESGFYCYVLNNCNPVKLIDNYYKNTKVENVLCFRKELYL